MRKELVLELDDGKRAYAVLRGGWQETVIVYLPCYGGNAKRDDLPSRAGRYFEAWGITFLGLNLYGDEEGARSLSDKITLEHHASDARVAIRLAHENGARNIHVVGHSLSAYPALMTAHAQNSAAPNSVILWDGSKPEPPFSPAGLRYDPCQGHYISEKGMGVILSRQYIDSLGAFSIEDLARGWSVPVLAVEAGDNEVLRGVSKEYQRYLGEKYVRACVIPGCGHHFVDNDELFKRTRDWVTSGYRSVNS